MSGFDCTIGSPPILLPLILFRPDTDFVAKWLRANDGRVGPELRPRQGCCLRLNHHILFRVSANNERAGVGQVFSGGRIGVRAGRSTQVGLNIGHRGPCDIVVSAVKTHLHFVPAHETEHVLGRFRMDHLGCKTVKGLRVFVIVTVIRRPVHRIIGFGQGCEHSNEC